MAGPERSIPERAEELFAEARREDALGDVAPQLLDFARVIREEPALRAALGDPSVAVEPKKAFVRDLLSRKAHPRTIELLELLVDEDLSARDLRRAVGDLAVHAALAQAEAEGTLGDVEDELFRFARIVESTPPLRSALTDPALPPDAKTGLLDGLLRDRAAPQTVALLRFLALESPEGDPVEAIDELADLAAARRGRVVVEARTAVPLDEGRRRMLAEALSRATGKDVALELVVDPGVVGGVVARVGDEVIDGTVRRKLELALERLTG